MARRAVYVPESTGRHNYLKPRPFARLTGFPDCDPGDVKNFPGKEKTHASVLAESPIKDLFLLICRDANPVILADDNLIPITIFNREPDSCDLPTMPNRIVYQIVKDLENQRVSEYLRSGRKIVFHHDISE